MTLPAPTVPEVRKYWQENPLHGFELTNLGSAAFFEKVDRLKREDIETFALDFWEFSRYRGKQILDVGFGPGWFTVQYALAGGIVEAVDLTPIAVELTQRHLEARGASAHVQEGNAECLPFADHLFDLVVAAGVFHHTPDTEKAFSECFRVLKPGAKAKISLYHKGILHHPLLFPFVKILMKLVKVKHPGADLAKTARSVDDFIRQYDGQQNPVGIGKTKKEWVRLLQKAGFKVEKSELHYFPKRFIPFQKLIPRAVHRLFDRFFGTMIYFHLAKPPS